MTGRDLLIRTVLGLPCIGIAIWRFWAVGDPWIAMISVFPCMLAFALIVYPSSTAWAGEFWGRIYMPIKPAEPKPYPRAAEVHAFHGRYEEALVEYERQLEVFPTAVALWTAMAEVLWVKLADRERARALAERAFAVLEDPVARRRFARLHLVHAERSAAACEDGDDWFWMEQEWVDAMREPRDRPRRARPLSSMPRIR